MRINIEPASIEFQSVKAIVTKSALVRYRAGRGDHEEIDFFVSVEPIDVFTLSTFHLRLQGEGLVEIIITFNPTCMKTEKVAGSMNIIDEWGKKIAVSQLCACRKSFARVTPQNIDAGWILPEKRKEIFLKVENISSSPIQLTFSLRNEKSDKSNENNSKQASFLIPFRVLKLQTHETKTMTVYFEPKALGRYSEVLEIAAPGGDFLTVGISGIAGIPLALHVEDQDSSLAGAAALTRSRCEFMKKFKKNENKEAKKIGLSDDELKILRSIMSATSDKESRREAHTLDFGICSDVTTSKMRCLTLMNLSEFPITVGLYSHKPNIKCTYLVRIAPRMAHSVEIRFEVNSEDTSGNMNIKGNFKTAIEIICPEFQNIPLFITAFVGQPLYFPLWEYAFFRPIRSSFIDTINTFLINESHYDVSLLLSVREKGSRPEQCTSTIQIIVDDSEGTITEIKAHSMIPVSFNFTAFERGPLMTTVDIEILKPHSIILPAAAFNRTLHLIGICIEPYTRVANELHDKNGIDFLRMWMSHPKRIIAEYPTPEERIQRFDIRPQTQQTHHPRIYGGADSHVTFFKENINFRSNIKASTPIGQANEASNRKSQLQQIMVQNRGEKSINITFFASTCFSIDPRSRIFNSGDVENVDVMYVPPQDFNNSVSLFGFGMALMDDDHYYHAVQFVAKNFTDFYLFPPPNRESIIILNFGRNESSTTSLEINTQRVLMGNAFPTSYSWDIKFLTTKGKFSPFTADMSFGELHPYESYPISFRFDSDISGSFECSVEFSIKETSDRLVKPQKIATFILRGQAVITSLSGNPDSLEFGSTVVYSSKRKSFVISNSGSAETSVNALLRPPFSVNPKSVLLHPKSSCEFEITYTPTESRVTQAKLHIFANQQLYLISLSGIGGTAELICEKYDKKDIDFGVQREGTVSWMSIYLTNKGTLPLALRSITASNPELVKLEFIGITSTVPYEGNQNKGKKTATLVRKDYWSILRRKLKVFIALKDIVRKQPRIRKANEVIDSNETEEKGTPIKIRMECNTSQNEQHLLNVVSQLRPFYSYHLRLGYLNKYQLKKDTKIFFHYMPITADDDLDAQPKHFKCMYVHALGTVCRPLELYPPFHDFGIAAAECFLPQFQQNFEEVQMKNNYGVAREGKEQTDNVFHLQVLNMSMEAQNLSLQTITAGFVINGRTWQLPPGEKIYVPVEFHPEHEQIQYQGEALFLHKYGSTAIRLGGTGASAEIKTDEIINFGSLKIQTVGSRLLRMINMGLLEAKYTVEIIQKTHDFKFHSEEPYECEGIIESGNSQSVTIECCCQNFPIENAYLLLRWLRVPRGIWEEQKIPLSVEVGMPVFRLQVLELDFKTTYIKVNKRIVISATNDGNAMCNWEAIPQSNVISVEPSEGILNPNDVTFIEVKFIPVNFEQLSAAVNFRTDAGLKVLMCYGFVGVPYLRIVEEMLSLDFGIVEINKPHMKTFNFSNSGSKPIEYEITVINLKSNGVHVALDDFDVFFVDPVRGNILPGETANLTMTSYVREYNSIITAEFVISTLDGEQYVGNVSATGGKAIIKIAPPTLSKEEFAYKPQTAEMSYLPQLSKQQEKAQKLTDTFESSKLLFNAHIDQLGEILAGLRVAEIDARDDFAQLVPRHLLDKIEATKSPSRPQSSGSRPGSTRTNSGRVRAGMTTDEIIRMQIAEEEKQRQLIAAAAVFDGSDAKKTIQVSKQVDIDELENYDSFDVKKPSKRSERIRKMQEQNSLRLLEGFAGLDPDEFPTERASVDESVAIKYMDDLASLETELLSTIQIGMSSFQLQPDSIKSDNAVGIGRYNPGMSKKRKTDIKKAIINQKNTLLLPLPAPPPAQSGVSTPNILRLTHPRVQEAELLLSQGKVREALEKCVPLLHAGRVEEIQMLIDDNNLPSATKLLKHSLALNHTLELRELIMAIKKLDTRDALTYATPDEINSILSVAKTEQAQQLFNDGKTEELIEFFSANQKEELKEAILRADNGDVGQIILFTRGVRKQIPGVSNVEQLLQTTNTLETIMNMIQQDKSISESANPEQAQKLVQDMAEKILDQTRGVIKAVKEQLSTKWLTNREFLTGALRKLQQTTHVLEKSTAESKVETRENDFSLGLLRGGDRSKAILLFNLPNEGNLGFDFEIEQDLGQIIRPSDFDLNDKDVELFGLFPTSGSIQPGESVNISTTFMARASGIYQQSYNLRSNGETVLTFTVSAKVGNPSLSMSPKTVDFGMVTKNKFVTRTIMLTNSGTYKDIWRIEPVSADALDINNENDKKPSMPFNLSPLNGEIIPGEDQPITVTFCAQTERNYSSKFRVLCSRDPLIVELKGVGGGMKLKPEFENFLDNDFGGLDWGTCVVGEMYDKKFKITNIGNVEGYIEISHSNPAIHFKLNRDSNGLTKMEPGASVDIKVMYGPSHSETIKDALVIKLPENILQLIPMRALSGIFDWSVTGSLDFTNMPVGDIQQRELIVSNTGEIPIPLELFPDPADIFPPLSFKFLKFNEGQLLTPQATTTIQIISAPKSKQHLSGKLEIVSSIGKKSIRKPFSFEFYAYDDEVALDNTQDASVGRIMVGESASIRRILTNFGNSDIKYRIRIETDLPESKDNKQAETRKKNKLDGKNSKRTQKDGINLSESLESVKNVASPWKLNSESGIFLFFYYLFIFSFLNN
ncbi:Cilia- and flagella-associated protein 47 [Nowakowskiella sp. JEL0078]|nr:Cilia- and flagella-associated protein 47 [Nowakowskiella sp. JEL0078]